MIKQKTCVKCEIKKDVSEFHKNKKSKDGLKSYCKTCRKEYSEKNKLKISQQRKEYRKQNKELINKKKRIYYKQNKEVLLLKCKKYDKSERGKFLSYKNGAKKRNIPWGLTFVEFMQFWQKPCGYCGDLIVTVGIDRIENNKGYYMVNCIPCCSTCNRMKMSLSKELFLESVKMIYEFKNQ